MSTDTQQDIRKKVAGMLLEVKAVQLSPAEPFEWSSGWRSPIYCDNRLTLSYPHIRGFIKNKLVALVKDEYPEAEAVAGVATAGIPQGVLVAEGLNVPFIYVRAKAKAHGMENQIEGRIVPGQKVVVIEDLISTGGSSIRACFALREAGIEVLGVTSIFTYAFALATENFAAEGIPFVSLSDYSSLLEVAVETGKIAPEDLYLLKQWREDPDGWGQ